MLKVLDTGPEYTLYGLRQGEPDRSYMIMVNASRAQLVIAYDEVWPFETKLIEAQAQGMVTEFVTEHYQAFMDRIAANLMARMK